jgi:hypothetical protein
MTAKRKLWGTGVSVSVEGGDVFVVFPVGNGVVVDRIGVADEVSLGVGERGEVAVDIGEGVVTSQAVIRIAMAEEMVITQTALFKYLAVIIT